MNPVNFHNDTVSINDIWYESHKTLIEKILIEVDQIDKIDSMVEKFLGPKQKLKKISDPNKPKRVKSAYLFFCEDKRELVKKNNPDIKVSDIMKELSKLWKNISPQELKKYEKLKEKDTERYQDEMEEYNLNK